MRRFVPLLAVIFSAGPLRADDTAAVEFFEKSVRPLFIEHCSACHGEKKQSAGLRLDTVAGIRAGADDGPVIIAGKPKDSRLITAVSHTGDITMPPEKKLSATAIETLTAWVERGAAMPKDAEARKIEAKSHWAFQSVKPITPPTVEIKDRRFNDIDRFIAAKLNEKGLALSSPADKRTLLRRVYFDLVGLPPTAEEADAFEKDSSPDAYEKVVDKLLASPHYGERWGRHWLDVARYADTKGYHFTEVRNFPFSFTYRDYVIQSLNADKPYNQFVIEQIAADRLDLKDDNRALAALGYLTLGRKFENNIHDIIDDRIEVVTRGFLGLSVGCARCHDHKYDPIPTRDYYSLYGVFASSVESKELPLLTGQPRTKETQQFEKDVAAMEAAADAFRAKMIHDALATFRTPGSIAEYLIAARDLKGEHANKVAQVVQERKLHTTMVQRWQKVLADESDSDFLAWHAFAALPKDAPAKKFDDLRRRMAFSDQLNPLIADALRDEEIRNLADVAAIYGEVIAEAAKSTKPTRSEKALREVLQATTHYEELEDGDEQFVQIAVKNEYRKLRNAAQTLRATSPNAPPRAMTMEDLPKPQEPVVFLRGNPRNPGPPVPRQFLEIISTKNRKPFNHGSGRLDLANAIADPSNPLTARVIVNRVWAWHFGQGLVRTPSDFGTRSDPPSHPELLDWLADQFVRTDGWSLKKLHKRIVLSATYRQSSTISEKALAADPENTLLSRSPRKRLEFEPLRDSLLAAAGTLDLSKIGGRSEDIFKEPFSKRRTVYAFIERQNLPATLRAFDLANPDAHSPGRYRTTTPQQALFLMNSPFIAEISRRTVNRDEVKNAPDDGEKVIRLYRAVLGRNPNDREAENAFDYIDASPPPRDKTLGPWEQLAQTLMMSNEFIFVD